MTDMPFETEVTVRYSDHDTLGHVNNAAYATFLEEGRFSYFLEVLDEPLTEISMVVASLEMDFHAPVTGRTVTVGIDIPEIGDRSFTVEYDVESAGETAVTASTVQVPVDPETGKAVTLPDDWRAAFEGNIPESDSD